MKKQIADGGRNPFELEIRNVFYVPEYSTNLLSPQLWSEGTKKPHSTGEITAGGNTILFWDDHKFSKLV